jgi:hypothetical protein
MSSSNSKKGWEAIRYADKLTRQVTHFEVRPLDDLKPHISDEDCECIPSCYSEDGMMKLIHNAFDGRELFEPGHAEAGQ